MHAFEDRCVRHQMEIITAEEKIGQLVKESKREKRPIPQAAMSLLQADLRLAEANLFQAECALAGFKRFPPVKS